MAVTINGTTGISTPALASAGAISAAGALSAASEVFTAQPVVTTPQSMIWLNNANANGTTNTLVPRFANVVVNQGTDITYTDSVTLGSSFTINTTGVYSISASVATAGAGNWMGITLNGNPLTAIISQTAATLLNVGYQITAGATIQSNSTAFLVAGSIIRLGFQSVPAYASYTMSTFQITKVS